VTEQVLSERREWSMENEGSVALQQKSSDGIELRELTDEQLHQTTLEFRDGAFVRCKEANVYFFDNLIPACKEIINRYKQQGRGIKHRLNDQPTIRAYFKSINLNYNTVRSWIHRRRFANKLRSGDLFLSPPKPKASAKQGKHTGGNNLKPRHLSPLEHRLLGAVEYAHDLVDAYRKNANVEEAIQEFGKIAPTKEKIGEYLDRPLQRESDSFRSMVAQLVFLLEEYHYRRRLPIKVKQVLAQVKRDLSSTNSG